MGYSGGIGTSELVDLLIAFVVLALAFSIINVHQDLGAIDAQILLISGLGVGAGFLLHELAHKFVAQRYGYRAEFQMWLPGLAITLLMSFMGFIIAMPGAVMIRKPSYYDPGPGYSGQNDDAYWDSLEKKLGNEDLWISLAGPITNIILAAIFFSSIMFLRSSILPDTFTRLALVSAFNINLILAAFNMLPIHPMDGEKIFRANSVFWVVVGVPAILAALYMMIGGFNFLLYII